MLFLEIPIRFIKIVYFIIFKNKKSFAEGIETLYLNLYNMLNDLKIEVLSRKIYLNCNTLGKLLISTGLHKGEKAKAFGLLTDLKNISLDVMKHESKMDYIKFQRGTMITQEDFKVYSHYTYWHNNALHATSKLPPILLPSQISTDPIRSLIKENAINPVSIITMNPKEIIFDKKIKSVSSGEVYSAIYDHLNKFEIPEENYKYIAEKVYRYEYVLQIYTKSVNTGLSKDLRCNLYIHALLNADSQDMLDAIEEWSNHVP